MSFLVALKLFSLVLSFAYAVRYWQNTRKANQALRDSAKAQAQAVVLQPDEVAPPPSGRVRVEGVGGLPDRIVTHTRVRTEQGPGRLTIFLPEVTTESHKWCSLFGYTLIGIGLAMGINACLPGSQANVVGSWVFAAILGAFGTALLGVEAPICRIELRDGKLGITRALGIWFRRTARVSRSASLKFRGESQAPFEMGRWQRATYYDLTIQRWMLNRRELIACDTGVGDWVTSVLQQWQRTGRMPTMVTPYEAPQVRAPRRSAA